MDTETGGAAVVVVAVETEAEDRWVELELAPGAELTVGTFFELRRLAGEIDTDVDAPDPPPAALNDEPRAKLVLAPGVEEETTSKEKSKRVSNTAFQQLGTVSSQPISRDFLHAPPDAMGRTQLTDRNPMIAHAPPGHSLIARKSAGAAEQQVSATRSKNRQCKLH
ncbi:hypothetical protein DL93DRAFT_2089774 [Clavulina sp. PMI_390]|nr:hypothetical protein DL93DRAFT_2089774 [Clavulina sp. PMI_390]